ncbi:MAG TPA: C25 family cysteine peptidase [Chloroflexaceae bacterium]|mgnify:CR=1 FL=1|nr:C25 family cysteine peptidase [Chloroflexaceae bacterium]
MPSPLTRWPSPRRLPLALALLLAASLTAPASAQQGALVREGRLRGQVVRVLDAGGGALRTELAGGPVADPGALAAFDTRPFATGAPAPSPLAARQAWKLRAARPGMQTVSAAALAAAGLPVAQIDPAALRLRHMSQEVAIEERRDGAGRLAELRFFAEPGDRWSAESVYWLTVEPGPGLRMATAGAAPAGALVTTTALERGAWRTNQIYESRLPGPDGDHFFSADMRVRAPAPGEPAPEPSVVTATLEPRLPPAPGQATLTLAGGSVAGGAHRLRATLGGAAREHAWSGEGTFSTVLSFPAGGGQALVELLPGPADDSVHLDGVAWALPVRLELGGRGARFVGQAGRAGYRLAGLPPGAAVYDVGDPLRPVRLLFAGDTFEAGAAEPRPYLVAGEGTLHAPAVAAHTPADLARPLDVEAVYVAPGAFLPAIEPLLAHRRAQGLAVAAVATEAIYDAWGHGQAGPEAIRGFLRYAAERWAVAPTTVVLVGDGTSDPRNYLGRDNINWVPPYLAAVDPWLGETACEACYAQLHGDSPLDDGLPDLHFGRIPAKSADEAAALAQKILRYERAGRAGGWRGTVAFVADNPDMGGDFAAAVAASAALQPEGVRVRRVIYDPQAPDGDPARERDPLRALARTMGSFNGGAAVVHYVGHGLQFQWGYTGPPLNPREPTDRQHLLGVFGVDELTNGDSLPVVLSMSCLTGSFQIPAFSGTSVDERLVARPDGGAIAAWGSTGLGVLYGHDALQEGFYRALWAAPGRATLGRLTMAGHMELFATRGCCQESIRTYALLGDPLTAPLVRADLRQTALPLVGR